jgi:hypothetical protein
MTMPAHRSANPLPASNLAKFRRRLDETRLFHLSRLQEGDDLGSDDIAMAMVRRSEVSLEAIDAALARMEAGGYGLCQICGGQISIERLDAVPHADVCARCAAG